MGAKCEEWRYRMAREPRGAHLPVSSKGRTGDFESPNHGSNPCTGTAVFELRSRALPFPVAVSLRASFGTDRGHLAQLRDRGVEKLQLTESKLLRSARGAAILRDLI